jgi:pilus assembly protein Flp/PilA
VIDYGRFMIQARLAKMDERGASAVEYGLLVAGIAAVIVLVVIALGGTIKNAFKGTCDAVSSKGGATATDANCSK